MSDSKSDERLRKMIGRRLKVFRKEMMKRSNLSFSEFAGENEIPVDTLKSYEDGAVYPDYADLIKIGCYSGLNLNWLLYENGGMFFTREKDMEEILGYIEGDETGRYEHYKMLLKSMQVPAMQDFIFYVHGAVVDLLSRVEHEILRSKESTELLVDMTRDVDYQWRSSSD